MTLKAFNFKRKQNLAVTVLALALFCLLGASVLHGQPKKEDPTPEEIPKPTILESLRFVGFSDGKVAMVARYTIVRSNHSNRVFAGGMQRRITGSKTWEEYNDLSKKRRR